VGQIVPCGHERVKKTIITDVFNFLKGQSSILPGNSSASVQTGLTI